ncbi:MAG: PAS domain S-box protein [Candidatus Methanoperedens sp.]|nr:PAS domain S-box protein [Candidatus Methanoperedens sp.]
MISKAKLIALVILIFLAGYFLEKAIDISEDKLPGSVEGTIEVISEFFSVFVAFSIFTIAWYSYNKSRNNRYLFLGMMFYFVGILMLFHLLSYPYMPEFFTPNSYNKTAIFLLASRIILATMFLASAYIHKDTLSVLLKKSFLISVIIIFTAISFASVYFYRDSLFVSYNFYGYSYITVFFLSITTAVILYACYRYFKEFKETGDKSLIYLIYGSLIIILSNIVYFAFEFSAHFLIITGFFYIFLSLYKSSVESPYEKLAIAEEKLRNATEEKYRNLFNNANDAIIIHDIECKVTSWNHASEKIFGWTAEEITGKHLLRILVPEESRAQMQRIACNIDRDDTSYFEPELFRKDGRRMNASMTVSNLRDENQNVIGNSWIIKDITERKQAEEMLKTLSLRNEAILASVPEIIMEVDENKVYKWANKAGYQFFGDDVIGKEAAIYFEGEQKTYEVVMPLFEGCEDVIYIESWQRRKDGEKRLLAWWCRVLKDSKGNITGALSTARDITESKQMEIALKENEARLSEAQRIAHLGNWEWNVKTNELHWAEENYRVFGLSRDVKPSLEAFLNTIHPDDLKLVQKSMDDALHGKPYDVDMHIIRPDGQEGIVNAKGEVFFDEENRPIRMSGTVQDITERKQEEEKLKLFHDLIEKSNDAITIVDPETGIILDANEKASSSLGYTRDELLNMHVYDFEITLPDTFSWNEHVKEIQKEGNLFLEGKHRRKDGTIFPIEVSVNLLEYENKSRIVAIVRDITERKKAAEMSHENERLVYASKAKNEFLSNMSHELRTPLNAVIGFSELLKMKTIGDLNEKQEGYVDNIRYGGKHLLNLISDILDLSKIDAGKMELVIENISVPETLDQTIVMVEEMAKKSNVSLIKELSPDLEFIEADKQRFIQILFNLLSNAIKFNRKKGGIVTVTTNREGDMAKFSVSDTGIGIKEEDKNKLFNDFEQLDSGITRKYGGTGLGLAITKKLVELHGGKMWVDSEFGVGSTFTFLLPIKANKGEKNT